MLHPFVVDPLTLSHQFGIHARAAIGLTATSVDRSDASHQPLIHLSPLTGGAFAPGIVAAARHAQDPAQPDDRVGVARLVDAGVDHGCLGEITPTAFLGYPAPGAGWYSPAPVGAAVHRLR